MTPQSIINTARFVVNDRDSSGLRQSDTELLNYVNEGIKEISTLRPEYFHKTIEYACVAGKAEQAITFGDAQGIVDVIRIKNGDTITPMGFMSMSRFNPSWTKDTAGAAMNWARYAGDPLRFYIYPPAPSMQTLELMCVVNPDQYAIGELIEELPDVLEPALADYVIYRAESKDDEHVLSARAASHRKAFMEKVTGRIEQPAGDQ